MKKLIFMLFIMCVGHTYAASEENEIILDDSTKTEKCYDKADILMSLGGGMFGAGSVTTLASRPMGFSFMGIGGILFATGGTIKIVNAIKNRDGDR